MFYHSIKQLKGEWIVSTPQVSAKVSLAKRNDLGILDHYVGSAPGVEVFIPTRVVPNGNGS